MARNFESVNIGEFFLESFIFIESEFYPYFQKDTCPIAFYKSIAIRKKWFWCYPKNFSAILDILKSTCLNLFTHRGYKREDMMKHYCKFV